MTDLKILAEESAERRTNIEGWVCKKCGRYWGDDERMARYCCATDFPCDCGEGRYQKSRIRCVACDEKKATELEQERFAKAKPVEYVGPFFVDDDFYFELGDYLDMCEGENAQPVEWAFVPVKLVLSLNTDDIIDNAVENLCVGMDDPLEPDGLTEFEVAVVAFNEANKNNHVWTAAYKRKFRVVDLHCYRNDVDVVVASSPSDATRVWLKETGEKAEDYPNEDEEWKLIPDDEEMNVPDETGQKFTEKTAAEWATDRGRCWLCSTEG